MNQCIAKKYGSRKQSIVEHGDKAFEEYLKIRNNSKEVNIIKSIFGTKLSDESKKFAIKLIGESVRYHDYGKNNINFQYKIGNSLVRTINFNSRHSVLGGLYFIKDKIDMVLKMNEDKVSQILLINYISILGFAISMHHTKVLKNIEDRFFEFCDIANKYINLDLVKTNTYYEVNVEHIFKYTWKAIKDADVSASIKFQEGYYD